jgi:divalent metal cation (Fe/Co/Zn/Cd) transporter
MDLTAPASCCEAPSAPRGPLVDRALRLEYLTVGWNVFEGLVAVSVALAAGSVSLLGFGIDSFVECAAGLVLIFRLLAERRGRTSLAALEATEHRARKLVAVSLFVLAGFVLYEAARALYTRAVPEVSVVGAALLMVSVTLMLWLAKEKRSLATALGSGALAADAAQTTACWWLSLSTLAGMAMQALFGFWWADPLAALVLAALVAREGREAWHGKACC